MEENNTDKKEESQKRLQFLEEEGDRISFILVYSFNETDNLNNLILSLGDRRIIGAVNLPDRIKEDGSTYSKYKAIAVKEENIFTKEYRQKHKTQKGLKGNLETVLRDINIVPVKINNVGVLEISELEDNYMAKIS